MRSLKKIFLLFLIVYLFSPTYGQEPKILFQSDSILKLSIKLHLNEVIHDLKIRDDHEAVLTYIDDKNVESTHYIKVKVRGKSRSKVNICKFPPLEINFKKQKTKNSIFEGQNKIKLVTHCNYGSEFKRYVAEEYFIYKMYQIVTPYSHNVRLCEITYMDLDKSKNQFTKIGFLIETIKDVAERNNMVVYKDSISHQDFCDRKELDKLTFFQYMVGNLDWEIALRHNIKLIAPIERGFPIAVPYDFDFSGLINTNYAAPPEGFGFQKSVRSRSFRGFCRFNNSYRTTLDFYQKIKPDIYTLVRSSNYLTVNNKKSIEKYVESFYEILDDPKKFNQKISTACWINHDHLYENN